MMGHKLFRAGQSGSCGIMWRTSRRGLAVRRLLLRRDGGQVMAEFALIVPVFLLLVIGIISFGRAMFAWIDANHLANETARWAAVNHNPYPTTLQQHVADNGFTGGNICITYSPVTADNPVPDHLTARVEKPVRLDINLPKVGSLGVGFTVRGTSTMRVEDYPTTGPTLAAGNLGTCP